MDLKSTPPYFGKSIYEPTKHIIIIKAKFIDPTYEDWDNNYPSTHADDIPTVQQTYERYRAYKIAQDEDWNNNKLYLYAETPVMKIYITKFLKDQRLNYRGFDIFHPKPSLVKSYKKERDRKNNIDDDKDDVLSTSMSTDG